MKKKLFGALMAAVLATSSLVPTTVAWADGSKVVTLGADLSDDQKSAILRYFGVAGQNITTLSITNQDERDHLLSYVPVEQIGTRTFSCALVNPTTSGGIQVRTANLSWVTSNMIASTLSTAGVSNCEVLAASPFEVSGTGALTGVIMAYETATGTQLDETKKDLANQELVTTGTIADTVGQAEATQIVNEIKQQVIENNITDEEEITYLVNDVVNNVTNNTTNNTTTNNTTNNTTTNNTTNNTTNVTNNNTATLSDADRELLNNLAQQIAQQQYDYNEMKENLNRVEQNVQEVTGVTDTAAVVNSDAAVDAPADTTTDSEPATEATIAEDSILNNADASALADLNGGVLNEDATAQVDGLMTEAQEQTDAPADFVIVSGDSTTTDGSDVTVTDGGSDVTITDGSSDVTITDGTVTDGTTDAAVTDGGEVQTADPAADPAAQTEATDVVEEPLSAYVPSQTVLSADNTADVNATSYEVPLGTSELHLYVPESNVELKSGTLTVTNQADGSVSTTDLTSEDPEGKVTAISTGVDAQHDAFGTQIGTQITLFTDAFKSAGTYTVQLDAALVQLDETGAMPEGDVENNVTALTTTVTVDGNGLVVGASSLKDFAADGQTLAATLTLGDDFLQGVASVDVASDDPSVLDVQSNVDLLSGIYDVTLIKGQSGDATVTVTTYDEGGNALNSFPVLVASVQ